MKTKKTKSDDEGMPIGVEQNPHSGTWDVGYLLPEDEGGFAPHFCGFATKEEAEAQIPGFDERVQKEFDAYQAERAEEERRQYEEFPNLAYVRSRINKIKNLDAHLDAESKLDALLNLDIARHITWPLPSWKAIKSGRVYGR